VVYAHYLSLPQPSSASSEVRNGGFVVGVRKDLSCNKHMIVSVFAGGNLAIVARLATAK
jgi:hypothetical protein